MLDEPVGSLPLHLERPLPQRIARHLQERQKEREALIFCSLLTGVLHRFVQKWAICSHVSLTCTDDLVHFLKGLLWIERRKLIDQRFRLASAIHLIEAEANEVLGDAGTYDC